MLWLLRARCDEQVEGEQPLWPLRVISANRAGVRESSFLYWSTYVRVRYKCHAGFLLMHVLLLTCIDAAKWITTRLVRLLAPIAPLLDLIPHAAALYAAEGRHAANFQAPHCYFPPVPIHYLHIRLATDATSCQCHVSSLLWPKS
jgi:hypothetical protein